MHTFLQPHCLLITMFVRDKKTWQKNFLMQMHFCIFVFLSFCISVFFCILRGEKKPLLKRPSDANAAQSHQVDPTFVTPPPFPPSPHFTTHLASHFSPYTSVCLRGDNFVSSKAIFSPNIIFIHPGAFSLAKHRGTYFSAVFGSKQDPIAALGPYENQEF